MSVTTLMPTRDQSVGIHFAQGTALAVFLTGLSFLVGLQFGWLSSVNLLEAFAVFTSYLCTYLCVVERRLNYVVGVITTAAYCVLFIQWALPASALVNAYLAFALVYGWFRWRSDSNARPVTRVELKWVPVYLIVTGLAYAGAVMLSGALGSTLPGTDSVILIGTILAQFLLDNKKIETWGVWAIVNIFAIYTYFSAGLFLAAFQFGFFLLNTVYGYYMWNKSRSVATQPAVAAVPKAVAA